MCDRREIYIHIYKCRYTFVNQSSCLMPIIVTKEFHQRYEVYFRDYECLSYGQKGFDVKCEMKFPQALLVVLTRMGRR